MADSTTVVAALLNNKKKKAFSSGGCPVGTKTFSSLRLNVITAKVRRMSGGSAEPKQDENEDAH